MLASRMHGLAQRQYQACCCSRSPSHTSPKHTTPRCILSVQLFCKPVCSGKRAIMWVQGNTNTSHGSEPVVSHGDYHLLGAESTGVEVVPTQSSGLARYGSVTRQQTQHQLFIPFSITPDVERRLHVSLSFTDMKCPQHVLDVCRKVPRS